jgi:hypothetical protein
MLLKLPISPNLHTKPSLSLLNVLFIIIEANFLRRVQIKTCTTIKLYLTEFKVQ